MIVKIFKPLAVFAGVRYNTNKLDKNSGELMKVSGFGPLQAFSHLRPQDYVNYLKMVSARNTTTKLPQFHAVISAKSRSFDKYALTSLAEDWLKSMGYGNQPYLLVYHKDTDHNHIHMVTTRIDKSGKRIDSGFEHMRAISQLNKLIGIDEVLKAKTDLEKAMAYNFSTKAQLMLVLEKWGYKILETDGKLQLIKYGKRLTDISLSEVKQQLEGNQVDKKRAAQLTAIVDKYRKKYSARLERDTIPLPGGLSKNLESYHSDLSEYLKETFGVNLIFHSKDGKPVYGYTVLDHEEKNVFKGGEVMELDRLLEPLVIPELRSEQLLADHEKAFTNVQTLETQEQPEAPGRLQEDHNFDREEAVRVSISDDIDDEAILGRNRRRKRKARTNTR